MVEWNKKTVDMYDDLVSRYNQALSNLQNAEAMRVDVSMQLEQLRGTLEPGEFTELCQVFKEGFQEGRASLGPIPIQDQPGVFPVLIQNMVKDGWWWKSDPAALQKMCTLRYDLRKFDLIGYGKRPFVKFRRASKYPAPGNMKPFRLYNDLNGPKYPNVYVAILPEDTFLYTELLTPFDKTKNHPSINPNVYKVGDGLEHDETYRWQWPSDYAKADGLFEILVDDKIALSIKTWQCEGTGTDASGKVTEYRGLPWDLFLQDGPSNPQTVFTPDCFSRIKDTVQISSW
jgi:hypothetical protein